MKKTNEIQTYIETNFPSLELKCPLFYNWPIGIRFELEKSNKNPNIYFKKVSERANKIYEEIFDKEDEVLIVFHQFTGLNHKFKTDNFCFQNIENLNLNHIELFEIKELYWPGDKDDIYTIACVNTSSQKINYSNILKAIANTEFGERKPQIEGDVFFVNKTKNIILNMYGDRGLDVISTNKNQLSGIFKDLNDWILDYDREKINSIFQN